MESSLSSAVEVSLRGWRRQRGGWRSTRVGGSLCFLDDGHSRLYDSLLTAYFECDDDQDDDEYDDPHDGADDDGDQGRANGRSLFHAGPCVPIGPRRPVGAAVATTMATTITTTSTTTSATTMATTSTTTSATTRATASTTTSSITSYITSTTTSTIRYFCKTYRGRCTFIRSIFPLFLFELQGSVCVWAKPMRDDVIT